LRRNDLAAPFSGIRIPAGWLRGASDDESLDARRVRHRANTLARVAAFALRMPSNGFACSVTAAIVHEMPLPVRLLDDERIHVGVTTERRAVDAAGVRGHRLDLGDVDLTVASGVRVTTAERTWCDLAQLLDLPDLVAAGDWLLQREAGSRELLRETVARFRSRRGARSIHAALPLLCERSESPRESRLRVHLRLAGLPDPEVNVDVYDRFGRFIGRGDLVYRRYRLLLEYEGEQHLTSVRQWERDIARGNHFGDEGWRIIRVTRADDRDPRALIERVSTHIRRSTLS